MTFEEGYKDLPHPLAQFQIFFFFCLFRAASRAHGGSQARGQIRAVAAILCHSSEGSELCL